jgi:FKBP-type peptidyl-prolyl cis-trans isomerase
VATPRGQRIGIWIIAIVMTVGTIGSFLVIILATQNQKNDDARKAELTAAYQKEYEAYQTKVDAQAAELSKQYFEAFHQYSSRVGAFDKDGVSELQKEDLKVGDGADVIIEDGVTVYYIGWNPEGKIFDGSIDGDKLKAPLLVTPGGVIDGWSEGIPGMKVGGVRELTIPAEKAYGANGSGTDIAPNTPIKFVVMVIPTPEKIAQPVPSAELLKLYGTSV